MRQDTQYENHMKKTITPLCPHRKLEDKPLIQRLESTIEWKDEGQTNQI